MVEIEVEKYQVKFRPIQTGGVTFSTVKYHYRPFQIITGLVEVHVNILVSHTRRLNQHLRNTVHGRYDFN